MDAMGAPIFTRATARRQGRCTGSIDFETVFDWWYLASCLQQGRSGVCSPNASLTLLARPKHSIGQPGLVALCD
jgi:hypothetical protein